MRISKKNAIKRMIKNNLKRILDMQIGKQYFSLKSRVDLSSLSRVYTTLT